MTASSSQSLAVLTRLAMPYRRFPQGGKDGAASFYVVDTSDFGNGGNWRVTADFYKENARRRIPRPYHINGVMELPKDQAVTLMPYDTVTVQGFCRSQPKSTTPSPKRRKPRRVCFFIDPPG